MYSSSGCVLVLVLEVQVASHSFQSPKLNSAHVAVGQVLREELGKLAYADCSFQPKVSLG